MFDYDKSFAVDIRFNLPNYASQSQTALKLLELSIVTVISTSDLYIGFITINNTAICRTETNVRLDLVAVLNCDPVCTTDLRVTLVEDMSFIHIHGSIQFILPI